MVEKGSEISLKGEKRKEYVKEQRRRLKENPTGFIKEKFGELFTYWKEEPLNAMWTFGKWVIIYYLIFGFAQALIYDMTYCDSSIDKYDGKIMFTRNAFAEDYNNKVIGYKEENEKAYFNPIPQEEEIDVEFKKINESDIKLFFEENNIVCKQDFEKWNNESIRYRINTTLKGLKMIYLKE